MKTRKLALGLTTMALTGAAALTTAAPANAGTVDGPPAHNQASSQDCGYSDSYIAAINTDYFDDGTFDVHVSPTDLGRVVGTADYGDGSDAIANDYWHAIQGCVAGLYGSLADSIYQQVQCHTWGGVVEAATGPTYDLESWHLPLESPGLTTYVSTHCLNDVGETRYTDDVTDPTA